MENITTWIILGAAALWGIWDTYIYLKGYETISSKITRWGKSVLAIVFLLGFLCGHWFG